MPTSQLPVENYLNWISNKIYKLCESESELTWNTKVVKVDPLHFYTAFLKL